MATILSIDTATPVCSVALSIEGKTIDLLEADEQNSHAEKAAHFVKHVLQRNKMEAKCLDAIAVNGGPGSYTGLRIGLALAKGLCYSLNIPLISINSLQILASNALDLIKREGTNEFLMIPMLDARRMDVYLAVLDEELKFEKQTEFYTLNTDSKYIIEDKKPVFYFGSGAGKAANFFNERNMLYLSGVQSSAFAMADIGFEKYRNSLFEQLAYYTPFYVNSFYAQK